jgi:arylsulfatase A-like enzyme
MKKLKTDILMWITVLATGLVLAEKPNFVLILADDLGWADVGFNGCTDIPTPNLDALAASGVRLEQGYVSASVCGPSRAGLLTGRYQQRFGCGENPPEEGWPNNPRCPDAGVPRSEKMLSELLQPAGYQTAVIGKWHLGMAEMLRPNARGFDYFYGFLNGAHSFIEAKKEWQPNPGLWPVFRNGEPLDYEGYLTDTFSDESVAFIERSRDNPFFLYLSYNAVHAPWQAPENVAHKVKHIANPARRTYAGMLVSMDDGIGRVIGALKDNGIYDNTIVVFLSDNGAPKNSQASSAPLRGNKGDTYEGGTRVPFLISWPAGLPQATVYRQPVSALDLAPTLLAAAGRPPAAGHAQPEFDGVDLLPYLKGESPGRPHELMFFRRDDDYAIRHNNWKLAWNNGAPNGSRTAELFNLADDPHERTDLIRQYPEKALELQNRFDAWDSPLPDNAWWGGPANRKRTKEVSRVDRR